MFNCSIKLFLRKQKNNGFNLDRFVFVNAQAINDHIISTVEVHFPLLPVLLTLPLTKNNQNNL